MTRFAFQSGFVPPSERVLDAAMDAYDRLERSLGDDPSAIADHMGWTRGTGAVVRRMVRERRGVGL